MLDVGLGKACRGLLLNRTYWVRAWPRIHGGDRGPSKGRGSEGAGAPMTSTEPRTIPFSARPRRRNAAYGPAPAGTRGATKERATFGSLASQSIKDLRARL